MESFIPQKGKIALQKFQKRGSKRPLFDTPIILDSFLADETEIECVLNEICKTNSLKAEKRQKAKETRSYDIGDMFHRQNKTGSKRSRAADKDPETIVVEEQLCLRNIF